jgi:hypothetical protein
VHGRQHDQICAAPAVKLGNTSSTLEAMRRLQDYYGHLTQLGNSTGELSCKKARPGGAWTHMVHTCLHNISNVMDSITLPLVLWRASRAFGGERGVCDLAGLIVSVTAV